MFKRIRQLHISLGAKFQLLFGAALALIIAAALAVPWQRMEQLTEQLNQRTAAALAIDAVSRHVAAAEAGRVEVPRTSGLASRSVDAGAASQPTGAASGSTDPASQPAGGASGSTHPASQPAGDSTAFRPDIAGAAPRPAGTSAVSRPAATSPASPRVAPARPHLPPRLVSIAALAFPERLSKFERQALTRFAARSHEEFFERDYEADDGSWRYRFAMPLHARGECADCHAAPISATSPASSPATRRLAAAPTTQPGGLLGIAYVDLPSQIESRQLLLNRTFILAAGLLAGTLAIAVFYLITSRLVLQPVRVLQETAEKVAEGDLNIRSDINTGDEFQQLSETFNVMLANLKAGEDQLRAINTSLDLKLGQMAESNVALYESNRLKNEFLANVSHELRTPLNSILGFADLLKDSPAVVADPRGTRYIQNILFSGRMLLELINDLLDLAKIEAGRMEVRSEPLSLGDLFEGLSSILKPLTEARELSLNLSVAGDVPIVQTDPAKLQQILYNLLSNAIKFSPERGTIDLGAIREGETNIRISITDRGPGIEPSKQQLIFEKFRQLDAGVTREHSGTGLGLSIARELTLLLGGSIGLRSTPGQGSTFWIVLPQKIPPSAQDLRPPSGSA